MRICFAALSHICLLLVLAASPGMAQNVAAAQTLAPPQLSADVELFNPTSGLYTSVVQYPPDLNFAPLNPKYSDDAPLPGVPLNEYGRLSWHSLEPSEGHYDFSIIDNVLAPCPAKTGQALCLPPGVKFGFRIMGLNPQVRSDTNVTTGTDGNPVYSDMPAYLETGKHGWLLPVDPRDATQGHYFIPDWNDPFFLARLRALLWVLGRRYDGDPRIGWIDIGLYGSWGEWHTSGLPDSADYTRGIPYSSTAPYYALNTAAYLANTGKPGAYQAGTIASKDAIVDAHAQAFRRTRLLMLTDDGDALCHALQLPGSSTRIGLRRDSLGSGSNSWTWQFPDALPDCDSTADQTLILDRWKTAPFIVEPYGNGSSPTFPCQTFTTDPTTGAYNVDEQVVQYHLAAIKNGAFCTGTWAALSQSEQHAVLWAGLRAGYRLAPVNVTVTATTSAISVVTRWRNAGVTPVYDEWNVEFSLWTGCGSATPHEVARWLSQVDLRTILPTGNAPVAFRDDLKLGTDVVPGTYELRIRLVDPHKYSPPMQLALQGDLSDGYYVLGQVVFSKP